MAVPILPVVGLPQIACMKATRSPDNDEL